MHKVLNIYLSIFLKGPDRATVEIRGRTIKNIDSWDKLVDEIQTYFDSRYIW